PIDAKYAQTGHAELALRLQLVRIDGRVRDLRPSETGLLVARPRDEPLGGQEKPMTLVPVGSNDGDLAFLKLRLEPDVLLSRSRERIEGLGGLTCSASSFENAEQPILLRASAQRGHGLSSLMSSTVDSLMLRKLKPNRRAIAGLRNPR